MGVNFENTSKIEGFNIFEKITTEDISAGGQNNKLNLYILKIHNKLIKGNFCVALEKLKQL